ncbi:MAG: hypothetical protein HYY24_00165 [Verrucomicrobia bacterium]|nr:hypothetical protein [Verrucomicrobiota bacterium]
MRELLNKRLASRPYVSVVAVRNDLAEAGGKLLPATLNSYLVEFTRAGLIHDAGRGWYSSLAVPFTLNREPLSSLVQQLNRAFPLLDFSCWSTEQIASSGHHLLAKFVSFVHTDRDSMQSVFEFLRDKGFDAHLNPRGAAAAHFVVRQRTVVVRPKVTTQPAEDHFVTIEGLLVDLFVERRDLRLIDSGEYFQILGNVIRAGRVLVGRLVEYAGKRKTAAVDLLESINREFFKNSPLIDSQHPAVPHESIKASRK